MPSPEDLRVFTTVVRKASFAEAAAAHNASPAFVSKRIRLLEQELGVKLLHRTTRRVAVTEQGERVYHWAQRILDEVEHLLQEVDVTRASRAACCGCPPASALAAMWWRPRCRS
jgi:LysR family transcriptional activator of dmlA